MYVCMYVYMYVCTYVRMYGREAKLLILSPVPWPPPVLCSSVCVQYLHGSKRVRKTEKAWSHSSRENDVRGMINRKYV